MTESSNQFDTLQLLQAYDGAAPGNLYWICWILLALPLADIGMRIATA